MGELGPGWAQGTTQPSYTVIIEDMSVLEHCWHNIAGDDIGPDPQHKGQSHLRWQSRYSPGPACGGKKVVVVVVSFSARCRLVVTGSGWRAAVGEERRSPGTQSQSDLDFSPANIATLSTHSPHSIQ